MAVDGFNREIVSVAPGVHLSVARSHANARNALLVIHGGPDWDHTYLRVPLVELCACHQLLLPDVRGCGHSSVGLEETALTPDLVVSDLVALMDAVEIDRCAVLGFSWGGLIAQRLTAAAPHRVERLIIASSSMLTRDATALTRLGIGVMTAAEQRIWSDSQTTDRSRAAAIAAASHDVYRPEARADYLDRVKEIRFGEEWARPWQAGIMPDAGLQNATAKIAATGVPVMLLHGRDDARFPASHVSYAADRLPDAQAVVIDDAAHMTHIDQPKAWITAIRTFLHA